MNYKGEEKLEPQVADSIVGIDNGVTFRGVVESIKNDSLIVKLRAPYDPDPSRRRVAQHGGVAHFVQKEVKAEDCMLIYRHPKIEMPKQAASSTEQLAANKKKNGKAR